MLHLVTDALPATSAGYTIRTRGPSAPFHSLTLVAGLQHLLGLAVAVMVYLLLRRRRVAALGDGAAGGGGGRTAARSAPGSWRMGLWRTTSC